MNEIPQPKFQNSQMLKKEKLEEWFSSSFFLIVKRGTSADDIKLNVYFSTSKIPDNVKHQYTKLNSSE